MFWRFSDNLNIRKQNPESQTSSDPLQRSCGRRTPAALVPNAAECSEATTYCKPALHCLPMRLRKSRAQSNRVRWASALSTTPMSVTLCQGHKEEGSAAAATTRGLQVLRAVCVSIVEWGPPPTTRVSGSASGVGRVVPPHEQFARPRRRCRPPRQA